MCYKSLFFFDRNYIPNPRKMIVQRRAYKRGARRSSVNRPFKRPRVNSRATYSRTVSNVRTAGLLGIEHKFLDNYLNSTNLTTAWATYSPAAASATADSISVPAVGTGSTNREGKSYAIESVMVQGYIHRTEQEVVVDPVPDSMVRVLLVLDTQTNGTELPATSVMTIGGGAAATDIMGFRDLQYSKRFKIIGDTKVKVLKTPIGWGGTANEYSAPDVVSTFKFMKTFKNPIRVECTGTTADVASVVDNNLNIIAAASDANCNISYSSRIRFVG